jgi:hypothetical protein
MPLDLREFRSEMILTSRTYVNHGVIDVIHLLKRLVCHNLGEGDFTGPCICLWNRLNDSIYLPNFGEELF